MIHIVLFNCIESYLFSLIELLSPLDLTFTKQFYPHFSSISHIYKHDKTSLYKFLTNRYYIIEQRGWL